MQGTFLNGEVVKITSGEVNSVVLLELPEGVQVVSVIKNGSVEHLGLKAGADVVVVIKLSNVMVH